MRYTLAQNAISSLSIAIDNFKKFYYHEEEYKTSEIDEAKKICIVFLENAVELMLKTILVSEDPLSIYKEPESRAIKSAFSKITDSLKLEDILISEGKFQTIKYIETIEKYNNLFHKSKKVYQVLNCLGQKRNEITHFGIDESDDLGKLTIQILNTFDVIYNYLYPQLIDLDEIGFLFKSDDLVVDTVHGEKFLYDDDYHYNNIVDFLDELMEISIDYVGTVRAQTPNSKIWEFKEIMEILLKDKKYIEMQKQNQIDINFSVCNFNSNEYILEINQGPENSKTIFSCYSSFFNVTAFCGECGEIYFIVVHDEHDLYIYKDDSAAWTQHNEPDYQWEKDYENGLCEKFNLSKRNLLLAFENVLQRM